MKKGFDQYAFATDGEALEFLEPFPLGHFRLSRKPVREKSKFINRNVPPFDPIQQMFPQILGKVLSPDARHGYSP